MGAYEKFDKEIRKEVDQHFRRSRWDDPLWKIARGSEAERAEAAARIDEAITTVLERHGIPTQFQIAQAPEPEQRLLALAA